VTYPAEKAGRLESRQDSDGTASLGSFLQRVVKLSQFDTHTSRRWLNCSPFSRLCVSTRPTAEPTVVDDGALERWEPEQVDGKGRTVSGRHLRSVWDLGRLNLFRKASRVGSKSPPKNPSLFGLDAKQQPRVLVEVRIHRHVKPEYRR